jgi:hypothetical protein
MLSRRHGIARYVLETKRVYPDRLTRSTHRQYLRLAERVLNIFRHGIGKARNDLHCCVQRALLSDIGCPPRRAEAFCKLLDDASTYDRCSISHAAELRRRVFQFAAPYHPLVTRSYKLFRTTEADIKAKLAAELGRSWQDLDRDLFADVPEFRRLRLFDGLDNGEALLSRYNVAQIQVALFDALSMMIWADDDFKTILRYAKLAGLMHTIERTSSNQYRIRLDGPVSVLRQTHRYGAAMAKFLPALIACRSWRMHALLRCKRPRGHFALELSSNDGLHSRMPTPAEFDSKVEERFSTEWGDQQDGWTLKRETEVLHRGQKVFVPDFVLEHSDGRRVLLEIVGYWTTAYLEAKLRTLQLFQPTRILVALSQSAAKSLPQFSNRTVLYKSFLRVKDVLQRLPELY